MRMPRHDQAWILARKTFGQILDSIYVAVVDMIILSRNYRLRGELPMTVHTYRGVLIAPHAARHNPCGFRWSAYVEGEGFVYADTLAGMRELLLEVTR